MCQTGLTLGPSFMWRSIIIPSDGLEQPQSHTYNS